MINDFPKEIIEKIENILSIKVIKMDTPPQGMDCMVVLITDEENMEYAVKYGKTAAMDASAYKLLNDQRIDIPLPKIFGIFEFKGKTVLILEKIGYPLLETIPVNEIYKYLPSMIASLKKIHEIKSDTPGALFGNDGVKDWQAVILSKFNRENETLDWQKIAERPCLDRNLVLQSVDKVINKIGKFEFINKSYSLLHTDFNQRNLFINPETNEIAGIIDWGEAMFGDPIYDFARVRMYIWHFNLHDDILNKYYSLLSFTPDERKLEELYLVIMVIEYLAYYSEEVNEFNVGRMNLHQDFLRTYAWDD